MEGVKEEGLLGTGIGRSMAPMLQETLGRLTGIDVVYPSHDRPESFAPSIPSFLAGLAARGVVGINVTHPFKERVVELLTIDDPAVRAIGAVNTIRFDADGARGFNTDYSGMQAAYRARFGDARPGVLAQLGAGGFGKAAILNVPYEMLRVWVKTEDDRRRRDGDPGIDRARIAQLERENRELRRANEILKAAASFFGAELDRQSKK